MESFKHLSFSSSSSSPQNQNMKEMPSTKRRKIEETVLNILNTADLETATEYSVRATASQLLCIDLSDLAAKICVRQVLESFLLSTEATIPTLMSDDVENDMVSVPEGTKHAEVGEGQQDNETKLSNGNLDSTRNCERVICKLPEKRNVAIHNLRKGQTLVSIRDCYKKDGKQFPSGRGITLTCRQWACLRSSFSAIEEAIARMQSKIRRSVAIADTAILGSATIVQNQMDADIPNPVNDVDNQSDTIWKKCLSSNGLPIIPCSAHEIEVERLQPHTDTCASPSAAFPQGHMEFFLKQLNVAYVLKNSCPSIPGDSASSEENMQPKVAAKKWMDDEYMCRHSILNSLSHSLYEQYSKKSFNAKELWEELKSVYSDDFGTVRSEVNKYIQFQMVDGVSVLGQVQELNYIANAITTSGIWIDENFHVSVIISKLPASWREYRAKLMRRGFLPLNMLVNLLKIEEDSQDQCKKENPSKIAQKGFELKKKEGKRLCYYCDKEGHISKYCPDRKLDAVEKSNGKPERIMTSPPESREVQTNTWRRAVDSETKQ